MTKDNKTPSWAKRAARARMIETGENYTRALREVMRERTEQEGKEDEPS